MYTLELEIEKMPTEAEDVCCYPVNINTFIEAHPPDSCQDTLIVEIETKRLLEIFLVCFDKTLKNEPYEQAKEVVEKITELLLAVGLTENGIEPLLLTEKLAVGIGHLLLQKVLFTSDKIRTRYEAGRDQADSFRLRLIIRPKSLRKWPWEFLWDRSLLTDENSRYYEGFSIISRNKTVSHSLSHSEELSRPEQLNCPPLRMLFVVANPAYRDEVKPSRKLRSRILGTEQLIQVQAALRGWCRVVNLDKQRENIPNVPGEAKIEIYVTDQTSWQKLRGILKKHSQRPFDIFHYVGHGWFSNDESKGYCLALENEDDKRLAKEISATEIGEALAEHGISLVILNACETSQERETAEGIAQTVAGFEIPAVIGMRYEISNIDSINFAEHFFAGLLDGKPIDFLVNDTRNALGRRFIYDKLFMVKTFQHDLKYLYPTICLQPLDGYVFTTDGSQQHTSLLEDIEKTVFYLGSHEWAERERAQRFLLSHPKEALGSLWIALLSDIDGSLRRKVAYLLGETGDELAVYPLAEALVNDEDAEVRGTCEKALTKLGQKPPAQAILVDQYTKNAQPKVLKVIETIDSDVADSAVWLRDSTESYQTAQDFYDPVAFLVEDARFGGANIIDLIDEIEPIYTRYCDLRQKERQIHSQIKSMDKNIDTEIEGISDPTILAIIKREKRREEKDEIDRQINELLDSFLDSTYKTLTEILDFLELNEVGLRALGQTFHWILQRREELSDAIPPIIRGKVEAQTERLNALREDLQALLEAESELRKFAQRIETFRTGFSPTSQ